MCSIKITLKDANGSQQTFARSVEKGGGEDQSISELATLQKHMGEVQAQVNAALTVLVDREKAAAAAGGNQQKRKESESQEDEEEDDDDDDDNSTEVNGSGEPPEKIRKTV